MTSWPASCVVVPAPEFPDALGEARSECAVPKRCGPLTRRGLALAGRRPRRVGLELRRRREAAQAEAVSADHVDVERREVRVAATQGVAREIAGGGPGPERELPTVRRPDGRVDPA